MPAGEAEQSHIQGHNCPLRVPTESSVPRREAHSYSEAPPSPEHPGTQTCAQARCHTGPHHILNTLHGSHRPSPRGNRGSACPPRLVSPRSPGPVAGSFCRLPWAPHTWGLRHLFHNRRVSCFNTPTRTQAENRVTGCHLDCVDQRRTPELPSMAEMYRSELPRGSHGPHVATEGWDVASVPEEPKVPVPSHLKTHWTAQARPQCKHRWAPT